MSALQPEGVTELLLQWRGGDEAALQELIPLVYGELRKIARKCMQGERPSHTLQATALVNEAYLRLVECSRVQWQDRGHFFAVAATLMRRVLVDEARKRGYQKRGGALTRVALEETKLLAPERDPDVLEIDAALERLAKRAPRKSRVVELRFFGGLTIEETADVLDVSIDIVKREWRTARLWLAHELDKARHAPRAVAAD